MAISRDGFTVSTDSPAVPFTFEHSASGPNRAVLVAAQIRDAAAPLITGVTASYAGTLPTTGASAALGTATEMVTWAGSAIDPAAAACTVRLDFNQATTNWNGVAIGYMGVSTATGWATATGTGTSSSVVVATGVGSRVVGLLSLNSGTASPISGSTIYNRTNGTLIYLAMELISTGTSVTISASHSGANRYSMIGVSLTPAGGGSVAIWVFFRRIVDWLRMFLKPIPTRYPEWLISH